MKKISLILSTLLLTLPSMVMGQTVKSPNGKIAVIFSLQGNGVPTYEMTYKGRAVVKPSHLGLELVKDKHASKGFDETNLMDGFTATNSKISTFENYNLKSYLEDIIFIAQLYFRTNNIHSKT